jgi:hypothetical protein
MTIVETITSIFPFVPPPSLGNSLSLDEAKSNIQIQEYFFNDQTWNKVARLFQDGFENANKDEVNLNSPQNRILKNELSRCSFILRQTCPAADTSREGIVCLIKEECLNVGSTLQTVDEISIEGNHQFFIAGSVLFVEVHFNTCPQNRTVYINEKKKKTDNFEPFDIYLAYFRLR